MMIGKRGAATTAISAARADALSVRGQRPRARRHGPGELHRVLLPARHRPRAERGAARLSRPQPHRHRRARADAFGAGGADDAAPPIPRRCKGAVAAGILGCGTVILGAARLCGDLLEPDARKAGRRRAACRGRPRRRARLSRTARGRSPASAIPCTSRSIPAPSACWRSQRSAASPAATSRRRWRWRRRRPKSGASRCR